MILILSDIILKIFSFDLEKQWIMIESIKFFVEEFSTVSIAFSFSTILFTEVCCSFYLSYFYSVIMYCDLSYYIVSRNCVTIDANSSARGGEIWERSWRIPSNGALPLLPLQCIVAQWKEGGFFWTN